MDGWLSLVKGPYLGKVSAGLEKAEKDKDKDKDKEKLELKIIIRFQAWDVMPLDRYRELSGALDNLDPASTFEVARLSPRIEEISQNLLNIFMGKGNPLGWLKELVAAEINQTDNSNVMFRGNSVATKAIDLYMKVVGSEFLERTIGDAVRAICNSKANCEVDPTRLTKADDVNQNWGKLLEFVTSVWVAISQSSADIPLEFHSIFWHIQATARAKFGTDNTQYTTVSGFFFLRFFCPAVLTPKLFGILNGERFIPFFSHPNLAHFNSRFQSIPMNAHDGR